MEQIDQENFDAIRFGWAGATSLGEGHYYRIQGQSFLIEFDNTIANANHIHTVWRDFDGDSMGDNFDPDDYFGQEEKSNIEIVLLDENKLPIIFKEKEEEKDSIVIKEINAGEHIVPGSQSQEKEIQLAGSPEKEKNCPITVVVKDSEGNIIDTLETEVSFKLTEEKTEQ